MEGRDPGNTTGINNILTRHSHISKAIDNNNKKKNPLGYDSLPKEWNANCLQGTLIYFNTVNWKESTVRWILFTFFFLYTSVRLMITSNTGCHRAVFLTGSKIRNVYKKGAIASEYKYQQWDNALLNSTLCRGPLRVQSVVMQWPLLISWSSDDCLRNEIAQVAADNLPLIPPGGRGGRISDTDTVAEEWQRKRDPNVKISVLYKCLCNIHAKLRKGGDENEGACNEDPWL